MKELTWRTVEREELAALLKAGRLLASRAVGDSTVYQLEADGREMLVVALRGGEGITVGTVPAGRKRRRDDTVSPASR